MDFIEVINKRRSTRKFSPDPIPDKILEELIEVARVAPSPGNSQNWCFGIVKEEKRKIELAKAAGNQDWIASAPVIIACCTKVDRDHGKLSDDDFGLIVDRTRFGEDFINYMNNYPHRKMANIFWNNANPLIPGEHIFLAAINQGLSSCWVGYLDITKVSEILNLAKDLVCLFLMPIGYANELSEDITRKKINEIIFFEEWKQS